MIFLSLPALAAVITAGNMLVARHSWLPEKSHVTPVNHISPSIAPRHHGSTIVRALNTKTRDGQEYNSYNSYNSYSGRRLGRKQLLSSSWKIKLSATVPQCSANTASPRLTDSDMGSEWSIIIQSSFCGILPWQAGGKVRRRPLGRKLLGKYLTVFSHWH